MKLCKYVMTSDTGLAPNPYFNICSLALCTPNHMNAQLSPGDWVLGHSTRATGNRLIYAMRLTSVLDMKTYFKNYPDKRPKIDGKAEYGCGDNLYDYQGGSWIRVPSAHHNNRDAFQQDKNRNVYLAEGKENYWYFGGRHESKFLIDFPAIFTELVQARQGLKYIYDDNLISCFENWLRLHSIESGRMGEPRDKVNENIKSYLIKIEPEVWLSRDDALTVTSGDKISRQNKDYSPPIQTGGCGK